jgi:hypothetical protein
MLAVNVEVKNYFFYLFLSFWSFLVYGKCMS